MPSTAQKKNFIAAFFLLILIGQCFYFARTTGQTVDEAYYNGSGFPIARYGDYRFLGEHPPLMMHLGALPLLFMNPQPKFQIDTPVKIGAEMDLSLNGKMFLYQMGNDPEKVLFAERSMVILVTMLLAWTLFQWAYELYGLGGATLSLILFTFCPNIIAHGSLYTTDMAVTAFMFIALYRLKRLFDNPSAGNIFWVGLGLGLALLSKVSSILLLPLFLLFFLLALFLREKKNEFATLCEKHALRLGILALSVFILGFTHKVIMAVLGPPSLMVLVWLMAEWVNDKPPVYRRIMPVFWAAGWIACYAMVFLAKKYGLPLQCGLFVWISFFLLLTFSPKKIRNLNPAPLKIFAWIFFIAVIVLVLGYLDFPKTILRGRPFANYLRSFFIAFTHTQVYHIQCVGGSFIECDWRYFTTVILAKTSLVSIALMAIGVFGLCFSPRRLTDKALVFLSPFAFWFVSSFINKIHIGLRHILPVYPYLYLIAGASIPLLLRVPNKLIRRALLTIVCGFVLFFMTRNIRLAPHYLSYFNEMIGGAVEGAKLTLDSNIEWGQDNRRMIQILKSLGNPPVKIAIWSFNSAEYDYYKIPWTGMVEEDFKRPSPGYYVMDIRTYTDEQDKATSWFRQRAPYKIAGHTLYLFKAE